MRWSLRGDICRHSHGDRQGQVHQRSTLGQSTLSWIRSRRRYHHQGERLVLRAFTTFSFIIQKASTFIRPCDDTGFRGVYQGLAPTIIKQGSNQAIRFFVMESLKEWYRGGDNNKHVPKLMVGAFGAIAGAASVYGNTPIDVVKTRMQVSVHLHYIFCVYIYTVPSHTFRWEKQSSANRFEDICDYLIRRNYGIRSIDSSFCGFETADFI